MQNQEGQPVVIRFFEALALLKTIKVIRGKKSFTDRYGINRWNLNTVEKKPTSDMFQVAWLVYLVRDYYVSPLWLLLGEGDVFTKKTYNMKLAASRVTDAREGLLALWGMGFGDRFAVESEDPESGV